MRVERDGNNYIFHMRQSSLGDILQVCQERSRRKLLHPEEDISSDAAVLGTACHKGIQWTLDGGDSYVDAVAAARQELSRIVDTEPVRWVDMDYGEVNAAIPTLMANWWKELRPIQISQGVLATEYEFSGVWLDEWGVTTWDDMWVLSKVTIMLEGTIDLITRSQLWDHKTAGREYSEWEKQRWALQPTVYCAVVDALPEFELEYPMRFSYGVMLKKGRYTTQKINVNRTQQHAAWLRTQIRQFVGMYLRTGTDVEWQTNDSHALCSPKWCPWWDSCKGGHMSERVFLTSK